MVAQAESENGVANRSAGNGQNGEAGSLSTEEEIERINRVQKETRARQHDFREPEMTDEEFKQELEELSKYDLHPAHEHNIRNAKRVVQ